MNPVIRLFRPADLDSIKAITVDGFEGVSVDHGIEARFGSVAGHDWRWRKARHIDDDVAAHPDGVFVAEDSGHVIGYITTRVDATTRKGRIPNLAVAAVARKQGIGRALISHALEHLREQGMEIAVIETMASNSAGQALYPTCGFKEVGRQIHYAQRL